MEVCTDCEICMMTQYWKNYSAIVQDLSVTVIRLVMIQTDFVKHIIDVS